MDTNLAAFGGSGQGLLANELPSEITDFIASARIALDQLSAREKMLEQRLVMSERSMDNELEKIYGLVNHFQHILNGADIQHWRANTEVLYKEGKDQAQVMHQTLDEIKKSLKHTCTHLDTVSTQVIKGITKTLNNLHSSELEQFAEDSAEQVKALTQSTIQEITEVKRWYHWKNLAMVFSVALLAAIFTGMFIDDEWPWESHKTVVKERVAGQALLSTWQQLSLDDQQRILSNTNQMG